MGTIVSANPANRRRSQRRRARSSVKPECRKGSYGLGPNLALQLLDFSDSGIRLIVSCELPSASEVEVILGGYGIKQSIKRIGHVRWALKLDNGSFCVGIEFDKQIPFRDWQVLASPN